MSYFFCSKSLRSPLARIGMVKIDFVSVVFRFLLVGLLLSANSANARPKIGLALGGGGAKGAAHIGVLRVLEQHNIPIDYICLLYTSDAADE